MEFSATEALLRRDRLIVAVGLGAIAALAWYYVATGAGTGMSVRDMTRFALSPGAFGGGMSMDMPWDGERWVVIVLMWWVMMIAMMVPSAAPTILLYGRVTRHAQTSGRLAPGVVPTAAFAAGYLLVWLGFSLLAAGLQFGLERTGLVSSMKMWSLDPWLSAGILLAAGIYQLTAFKHACLAHCRAPTAFLTDHWRPGRIGALAMGARHGLFCVGCCWALMALLFVGGIMNLLWIAALAILVLVEKLIPRGEWVARASGALFIAAGLWIAVRAAMPDMPMAM